MKKIKEELLLMLSNTSCKLKPSNIHGIGVFAIKDILEGSYPCNPVLSPKYFTFTEDELQKLPAEVLELISEYCYSGPDEFTISQLGLNTLELWTWINHDENNNVIFDDDGLIIAIKDIKKDEELLLNYSIISNNHSDDMDGDHASALASVGWGTDEDYGGTDERM